MQYPHIFLFDTIEHDVLAHGKTADAGVTCKKLKVLCQGVDEPVGNIRIAALSGNVKPDAVELGFRFRRGEMGHSGGRSLVLCLLGRQPCAPALLDLGGQIAHGLLGDDAALPARNRCLRRID